MVCSGCRGECVRPSFGYKTRKNIARMPIEDAANYKYCVKCVIFIKTDDRNCPCCQMHMRHSRRFKRGNKEKYKEIKRLSTSTGYYAERPVPSN